MASSISDKLSRNGDAAATFAFISSRIRHRRFGTAVALSAYSVCTGRLPSVRSTYKHVVVLGCATLHARADNRSRRSPAASSTADMSRSSGTRPSSGAAGSQAASTIRTTSASASGTHIPGFGYPPGVYNDPAVAIRLQVTPRDASVYVDGYAAGVVDDYDGVFQRLRLVPGPHEIVIYHPSHRTLRQNIYYNPGSTHTIRHTLEPLAARRSARAAAATARDACVSRNAARPTGCA